jgi:ATP-dependent DNA helicase RecG
MQENEYIEYKSSFNNAVIETLVAFANCKGGKVLVGLNDDGSVNTNFTYGKETFQNWINETSMMT